LAGKTEQNWKLFLFLAIVQMGLFGRAEKVSGFGQLVTADLGQVIINGVIPGGTIEQDSGLANHGSIFISGSSNATVFYDVVNDGVIQVDNGSTPVFVGTVTGSGEFSGRGKNLDNVAFLNLIMKIVGRYAGWKIRRFRRLSFDG